MTRREILQLAGAGAAGWHVAQAQTRRPNLVILYADDMGWRDVSFNGRKEWQTPNLDRLGSQGTIFNRWYTGMPLCARSRACLLTGKYTIHHGVRNWRQHTLLMAAGRRCLRAAAEVGGVMLVKPRRHRRAGILRASRAVVSRCVCRLEQTTIDFYIRRVPIPAM